jgi:hypothetical protein
MSGDSQPKRVLAYPGLLLSATFLSLALPALAPAATFYVAPAGNDASNGSKNKAVADTAKGSYEREAG